MKIKGSHADAIPRGNEIAYRLLPFGREYITKLANAPKESADTNGSEKKQSAIT
jgi:hypothetical protein